MNYKKIFLFCFLLLAINFVAASYELGNQSHYVSSVYGPGSLLIGELNISFTNHPINSLFTDSEGNSVELKDVLNTSSNYLFNYSCDVLDCGSSYESLEKKTTDSYVLLAEDELVIGLEFKGNIEDINSLDYTVQSNAPAACSSQFRVDFLDDGVFDYSNTNSLPISCDNKNTGCYNISQGGEETKINVVPFCQKIEVPETPKVELGVWLKEKTPGTSSIKMSLYDLEGDKIDECEIEKSGMTSVGSEVSCLIDYAVIESEDYYVCTSATNNDGDYRTKGYDAEEECGFYGSPVKNASANYYLFARGQKYNAPGEVVISNQLGPGKYSSFLAEEYLVEKYGSMNCESGCYVPIRIISNVAQTITLKDFSISYDKTNFPGTSSNEFHELNTTPAKVSSDMLWLSLNGLFNLSDEFGEFDYSLNLDGEELFEEELEIKNASIILNPTIVAAGFAVTFEAEFLSELNVTSYLWDFGVDGKRFETFSNKKTVTFEEEGNYTLVLMVDAGDAFFSKEFLIEVQSPKETIEKILLELNYKKENLETQILDLDSFIREKVKEDLNWANVSLQIELLKEKYDTAKITGNYSKVIPYTSDIDLPSAVIQSSSGKISYYPELSDIDVDIVSKVFGDFYEEENYEKYSEAILFFNMNDYQVKTSMKDVSYNWDGEVVPFAKTFYLDISGKNYDETKLFISDLKGLEFNIEPTKEGSYWVLPIRSSIVFSTTSNVDIADIPMFLAPSLSSLSIIEGPIEDYKFPWWILIVSFIGLLILGGLVYFVLHKWYDKKYEKSLFPNKNNLFNLITYINNQKTKGVKEAEIRTKLHKAKWSSEQIRYVLRKYLGKNTGMWKPEKKPKVKKVRPAVVNKTVQQNVKGKIRQAETKINPSGAFKKRDIFWLIFLGFITLGLRWGIWLIVSAKELRKFDKKAPKGWLVLVNLIFGIAASILPFILLRETASAYILFGVLFITLAVGIIVILKYSAAHNRLTGFSRWGLFILLLLFSPIGIGIAQNKLNKVATPRQKT